MVVRVVTQDVTQLVMTDVTIVKQAITPVRDIPAQTVTATAMTITQQKTKSPAVTLRLGVIPELPETLKSYILLRRIQAPLFCNYIYRLCIDVGCFPY